VTVSPHGNNETADRNATQQNQPELKSVQSSEALRQWIIVADRRQAHIYKKTLDGIERVPEEFLHCSLPLPRDEASEDAFLRDLGSWLDAARREDRFDRLAIVASSKALKALLAIVGDDVHSCIRSAQPRDVAEITEEEIADHIADTVWL
jgi:hypothetical protein